MGDIVKLDGLLVDVYNDEGYIDSGKNITVKWVNNENYTRRLLYGIRRMDKGFQEGYNYWENNNKYGIRIGNRIVVNAVAKLIITPNVFRFSDTRQVTSLGVCFVDYFEFVSWGKTKLMAALENKENARKQKEGEDYLKSLYGKKDNQDKLAKTELPKPQEESNVNKPKRIKNINISQSSVKTKPDKDSGEWVYLGKIDKDDYYYDMTTIQHNYSAKTIKVWIKIKLHNKDKKPDNIIEMRLFYFIDYQKHSYNCKTVYGYLHSGEIITMDINEAMGNFNHEKFIFYSILSQLARKLNIEDGYKQYNRDNNLKDDNLTPATPKPYQELSKDDIATSKLFNISDVNTDIILIIVALLIITGVILGFTRTAVFYYNTADLFISFIPYILLFVSFLISDNTQSNKIIITILLYSSLLTFLFSSFLTLKYNKYNILLSIPVMVSKIFFAIIIVCKLLVAINPPGETESERRRNRWSNILILLILSSLVKGLINGEEVYYKKGWMNEDKNTLKREKRKLVTDEMPIKEIDNDDYIKTDNAVNDIPLINCQYCQKEVASAGKYCNYCGKLINQEDDNISKNEYSLKNDTKKCRYCRETIKLEASKCHYCKSIFDKNEVYNDMLLFITKKAKGYCPKCGNKMIYAFNEEGGMGYWCNNCNISLNKMYGLINYLD